MVEQPLNNKMLIRISIYPKKLQKDNIKRMYKQSQKLKIFKGNLRNIMILKIRMLNIYIRI